MFHLLDLSQFLIFFVAIQWKCWKQWENSKKYWNTEILRELSAILNVSFGFLLVASGFTKILKNFKEIWKALTDPFILNFCKATFALIYSKCSWYSRQLETLKMNLKWSWWKCSFVKPFFALFSVHSGNCFGENCLWHRRWNDDVSSCHASFGVSISNKR